MNRREILQTVGLYRNYIIMALVSLMCVFFFPFLGSVINLQLQLPNTAAGWIVFIMTKLCVAAINVLIFHCFVSQGKENVKDDPRYLEATQIMQEQPKREGKILSPEEFLTKEYSVKGGSVFVLSVLSAFSLSQAILSFDLLMMLTYVFTILGGVIGGWLEMGVVEDFWTYDYLIYAKAKQRELAAKTLEEDKGSESCSDNIGGAPILESPDSDSTACLAG